MERSICYRDIPASVYWLLVPTQAPRMVRLCAYMLVCVFRFCSKCAYTCCLWATLCCSCLCLWSLRIGSVPLHSFISWLNRLSPAITTFFLQMAYGNTGIEDPAKYSCSLWAVPDLFMVFSPLLVFFLATPFSFLCLLVPVPEPEGGFDCAGAHEAVWSKRFQEDLRAPDQHTSPVIPFSLFWPTGRLAPARQSFHSHAYIYIKKSLLCIYII